MVYTVAHIKPLLPLYEVLECEGLGIYRSKHVVSVYIYMYCMGNVSQAARTQAHITH